MKIDTPLYGVIDIPDDRPEILEMMDGVRKCLEMNYSQYEQVLYDALSEGLDKIRRAEENEIRISETRCI